MNSCYTIALLASWSDNFFVIAADFMMILRVWAVYHQSKVILGTLLTLFVVESVLGTILCIMMYKATVTMQVLDLTFCVMYYHGTYLVTITQVAAVFHLVLGTAMFVLMSIQYMKEALQMHKVTKKWQPNHYMNLLLWEGVLYYFIVLLRDIVIVLTISGTVPGFTSSTPYAIGTIVVTTLTPRFIMNIRELYARELRGRCGSNIDSGFGFSTPSGQPGAGGMSEIVFAEAGQNQGLEQGEETPVAEQ